MEGKHSSKGHRDVCFLTSSPPSLQIGLHVPTCSPHNRGWRTRILPANGFVSGELWLVCCTAAVVNSNRGFQGSMSWTAGTGSLSPLSAVTWSPLQPISALCPPLLLAPSLSFARFGSFWLQQEGEGRWKERREEEREGGEARQRASLYRERVKELENENGERESLPSVWISRR